MKNGVKKITFGLFFLTMSISINTSLVNAAMFKTTWTGNITYIDASDTLANSIWNVGDIITFTAIYDNEIDSLSTYSDGPNGIAEFGEGDDILLYSWSVNTSCCNWWSDAQVILDPNTDTYIKLSQDGTMSNYSMVGERVASNSLMAELEADGVRVWNFSGHGGLYTYEDGKYTGYPVRWRNNTVTTSSVPLPGAVWLMGSGLVGLIGLKCKKNLKSA